MNWEKTPGFKGRQVLWKDSPKHDTGYCPECNGYVPDDEWIYPRSNQEDCMARDIFIGCGYEEKSNAGDLLANGHIWKSVGGKQFPMPQGSLHIESQAFPTKDRMPSRRQVFLGEEMIPVFWMC